MDDAPRLLVLCPTARDRTLLARPEIASRYRLQLRGTDEATHEPGFDALRFLDETLRAFRPGDLDGVVGIDDFPASMLAALVAERRGYSSPSFRSLFLCQHKFYSRLEQRQAVPEVTPRFQALDVSRDPSPAELSLTLPVFVKPVKSYLSILARPVRTREALTETVREARTRLADVAAMLDALVGVSKLDAELRQVPASALLVEELLGGRQVTLDGYAFDGRVVVLGIVDSHFFPGTSSFARFEYPSELPVAVQERMAQVAERVIRHIGLDRTFFDIEFFHREDDDAIGLIEINGRMSSQFAPLYRMVDGIDLYAMQLDMAVGRDPGGRDVWNPRGRRGPVAGSFVLRRWHDGRVRRVPTPEDVARLLERLPRAFVEVLAREGARLSDELQDDSSYRYGLVDLCAEDRPALLRCFEEAKALLPFVFD